MQTSWHKIFYRWGLLQSRASKNKHEGVYEKGQRATKENVIGVGKGYRRESPE